MDSRPSTPRHEDVEALVVMLFMLTSFIASTLTAVVSAASLEQPIMGGFSFSMFTMLIAGTMLGTWSTQGGRHNLELPDVVAGLTGALIAGTLSLVGYMFVLYVGSAHSGLTITQIHVWPLGSLLGGILIGSLYSLAFAPVSVQRHTSTRPALVVVRHPDGTRRPVSHHVHFPPR